MKYQKLHIKNQKYIEKVKNICFLICIFTICYLIFTIPAKAQTFSLGIYPPLLEVIIMPGKSVSQNYELANSGDQTEITAQIIPFEPKDEHGNIKFPISSFQFPVSNWFSFENADLSLNKPFPLKSGEKKQIILKIKIPPKTEEDDYYFSLLFASSPQGRLGFSGTTQAGVIGTNILITVSKDGQPVKKGEIVEFTTSQFCLLSSVFSFLPSVICLPIQDSFDKPEFLLRVKNTGRTFWKPSGSLRVEGLLGQKWEQELQPENILANSIRQINVATPSASPNFQFPISNFQFLIGPYRAKVEFTPEETEESGESQILSATTTFLALPFKAFFGLLTSLIILFMIKSTLRSASRRTQGKV